MIKDNLEALVFNFERDILLYGWREVTDSRWEKVTRSGKVVVLNKLSEIYSCTGQFKGTGIVDPSIGVADTSLIRLMNKVNTQVLAIDGWRHKLQMFKEFSQDILNELRELSFSPDSFADTDKKIIEYTAIDSIRVTYEIYPDELVWVPKYLSGGSMLMRGYVNPLDLFNNTLWGTTDLMKL